MYGPKGAVVKDFEVSHRVIMTRAFPHLFPYGRCGIIPSDETGGRIKEYAKFRHWLMMYNDERFVSEPDFIFWLFNTYRRSEIVSLVAFVAKRDVGVQVTKDDIVNAVKYLQRRRDAGSVVDARLKPESAALARKLFMQLAAVSEKQPGTAMFMQRERSMTMASISSAQNEHPTFFTTYTGNEFWLGALNMIMRGDSMYDFVDMPAEKRKELIRCSAAYSSKIDSTRSASTS
jgi:hypothetical protein